MVWATLLLAQCCGGAENVSAVSKNGRFKVDAVALTPRSHGPYPFRYKWSERRPDGDYLETFRFEVKYDSTDHFNMQLFVSPTGNGFLVASSISRPALVFYSRSGENLYTVEPVDPSVTLSLDSKFCEDGACLQLFETKSGDAAESAAVSRLFLPLGRATTGMAELLREPQKAYLQPHLIRLDDDDPQVREVATESILAMGDSAIEELNVEMGRTRSAEARGRIEGIVAKIRQRTKDHVHPHRHLLLLAAALSHPDKAIASLAGERLRAILPKNAKLEAAWIEEHFDELRWDEGRQSYR